MIIRIVEFSIGGTKLERIVPKKQHNQWKLLNFENWCSGEVQKVPKFDFQSQNHPNLSHFLLLKNTNLGAHFLLLKFLMTSIFK
jgi:hypothetical protein